jgi:hypothetical protein
MKSGIAIALIICGTLLVITPAAYDYMLARNVSNVLLSRTDMRSVSGGEPLSSTYTFVCWAFGAIMIGVAIVRSLRIPQTPALASRPAAA